MIPGAEPGVFVYDRDGAFHDSLDAETFFAEGGCDVEANEWGRSPLRDAYVRADWLGQRRLIDEVVADGEGNVYFFVRYAADDHPEGLADSRQNRASDANPLLGVGAGWLTQQPPGTKGPRRQEPEEPDKQPGRTVTSTVAVRGGSISDRVVASVPPPTGRVCWDLVHARVDDLLCGDQSVVRGRVGVRRYAPASRPARRPCGDPAPGRGVAGSGRSVRGGVRSPCSSTGWRRGLGRCGLQSAFSGWWPGRLQPRRWHRTKRRRTPRSSSYASRRANLLSSTGWPCRSTRRGNDGTMSQASSCAGPVLGVERLLSTAASRARTERGCRLPLRGGFVKAVDRPNLRPRGSRPRTGSMERRPPLRSA